MKNLNMSLFKISIVGVLMSATITSCKKKDGVETPKIENTKETKKDYEKVLSFFAWSLGVPKDSVTFDVNKSEFTIPNTPVRQAYSRVQEEYNKANEYKLTQETK
ncbi:hypothetical protein ABIB40_001950 [Pedobacter sp. UYP30]|uniref:hypothetical protein n=1 Tax=Pedobacter sp. UYP30 TaxID=1756400 RepID=UPI0033965846